MLLSITPDSPTRQTSNSVVSTVGGLLVCAVLVGACLQLRGIRRRVYARPRALPVESDPAVVRAMASRERRDEARKMWNSDPALARELGIGRPDLGRGFDDGGLFELNSAPAAVIAAVCGLDPQQAEAIVAARKARGGSYFNVGELFVDVPLPDHVQRLITERALV